MHTATQTFVEAGGTGKDFSQSSVKQEADTQVFYRAAFESFLGNIDGSTIPKFVHDLLESLVVEQLDGAQTFGENFTVTTVRSEDKVVDVQHVGHADSSSLLTGRQVGRTGVVVFNAIIAASGFYQLQHRFEFADHDHVAIDAFQILFGEVFAFQLILHTLFILIDRDRREGDFTCFTHLLGIDVL